MAERRVLFQRQPPPLKQIMPLYHGPVSPQHKTMLSLLYAQLKIQTNSILRASNSAATGAYLTTSPQPVGSIISAQSYCLHAGQHSRAYRCSVYNIGTTANSNIPRSIARIPSARVGYIIIAIATVHAYRPAMLPSWGSQRITSVRVAGRTPNSRLIARIQSSHEGYILQLPFGPNGSLLSARHPERVKPSDRTEPPYYLNKCSTVGTTYVIFIAPRDTSK